MGQPITSNEIHIEVEAEMLDVTSPTLTKAFGVFGFAPLVICLLLSLPWIKVKFSDEGGAFNPTDVQCRSNLKTEAQPSDGAGILRVIDVWPRQTSINRHVCVSVAGVVSAVAERRLAEEVVRAQKARTTQRWLMNRPPGSQGSGGREPGAG